MEKWHYWDRVKLRIFPISQSSSTFPERRIFFLYLSGTIEFFFQRLALLTWIGELELARKLWEEEKKRRYFWGMDFEDFLFRVVVYKDVISGYMHPEFREIIGYRLLREEDAFKLSTIPISELLKMDKPHFRQLTA